VPILTKGESTNTCLTRWALAIADVNFSIKYIPGWSNPSDALSRLVRVGTPVELDGDVPLNASIAADASSPFVNSTCANMDAEVFPTLESTALRAAQLDDPYLASAIAYLEGAGSFSSRERKRLARRTANMIVINGVLHCTCRRER
jgi:hypothetical protein